MNAQNKTQCAVLFDYDCHQSFPILSDEGNVVGVLANNFESEDWPVIVVEKVEETRLYAGISTTEGWISGWISRKAPLCIQARSYNDTIELHTKPSKESDILILPTCMKYNWDWLRTVDYDLEGFWLKVIFMDDAGEINIGWLAPSNQCPNPYSTCN